MQKILLKNVNLVNEGTQKTVDILIEGQFISRIDPAITDSQAEIIEGGGLVCIPGMIDDQVHFREPGLTHKGEIYTEAKAAVAGGITSYMEMPNTIPNALTRGLLEEKYARAAQCSLANYSFYMGASNRNTEEILRTDPEHVCGVKIFMGSSTGDMLVEDVLTLENIFSKSELLIATHCEDEKTIRTNMALFKSRYGDELPVQYHPLIRSEEACYKSSSFAVSLANKFGSRLHVLHISTAKELSLFDSITPLNQKKITAEACIHHLWFDDQDYHRLGAKIKWNPAIKTKNDRESLIAGVRNNTIDVIATDHAPHTIEEKNRSYFQSPSGGPLVQHALPALFEMYHRGKLSLEQIVNKTSHAVADCFRIVKRGYVREGYFADLVLINLNNPWQVQKSNLLYKCGWSPFEGNYFKTSIDYTFINGHPTFRKGKFDESRLGKRLKFTIR